tara:strand:+ start:3357 stop:3536 length:180 start_codon:yes stop_codon:yes gene_type:complete
MKMNKKAITGMLFTAGAFAVGLIVANQIKKRVKFFNASGDFMLNMDGDDAFENFDDELL